MQQEQGLDVRWVDADEARRLSPTLAERGYRGGSYVSTDGWLDPPTNVQAYLHAMRETGVELRERTAFLGLRTKAGRGGSRIVTGVETSAGTISTGRVILAAGPGMQAVAKLAGGRAWVGYARHQVVVTQPHPDLRARAVRRDDLRHARRDLLAPRGGRDPLGDVEPARGARRQRARSTGRTSGRWRSG